MAHSAIGQWQNHFADLLYACDIKSWLGPITKHVVSSGLQNLTLRAHPCLEDDFKIQDFFVHLS